MEIASEAGTSVGEQTLHIEDLLNADEVFVLTNRNVIGVKEIAGQALPSGGNGEITNRLDTAFEGYVREYVSRRLASNR